MPIHKAVTCGFSMCLTADRAGISAPCGHKVDRSRGSTLDPIGRHHLYRENLESNLRVCHAAIVGFGFRTLSKWRMSMRVGEFEFQI